jgi:hypothetical protein
MSAIRVAVDPARGAGNADVVDEHIEAAQLGADLRHDAVRMLRLGSIPAVPVRPPPEITS